MALIGTRLRDLQDGQKKIHCTTDADASGHTMLIWGLDTHPNLFHLLVAHDWPALASYCLIQKRRTKLFSIKKRKICWKQSKPKMSLDNWTDVQLPLKQILSLFFLSIFIFAADSNFLITLFLLWKLHFFECLFLNWCLGNLSCKVFRPTVWDYTKKIVREMSHLSNFESK